MRAAGFWFTLFSVLATAATAWPQFRQDKDAAGPDQFDPIVKAFIQYDTGALRGAAGQAANQQFQSLSVDEAIPAVVRGVNQAARLRASCPIIVTANKLTQLLQQCRDPKMLRYVSEHLDVGPNPNYGHYMTNLRRQSEDRLRELEGRRPQAQHVLVGGTPGQLRRSQTAIADWSLKDLQEAVGEDTDAQLMRALDEITDRKGSEYTDLLAKTLAGVKPENREIVRGLLARRLTRMTDETLRGKLQDPDAEVRAMAARAMGYKGTPAYAELIALLRDKNPATAEEAHAVLTKLSGEDFGPAAGATAIDWFEASKRWDKWYKNRSNKPAPDGPEK